EYPSLARSAAVVLPVDHRRRGGAGRRGRDDPQAPQLAHARPARHGAVHGGRGHPEARRHRRRTQPGLSQPAYPRTKRQENPAVTRLSGKRALVTGGASGIGKAIATLFLQNGARTVISDINADNLASAAEELSAHGTVAAVCGDVRKMDDAARMVNT